MTRRPTIPIPKRSEEEIRANRKAAATLVESNDGLELLYSEFEPVAQNDFVIVRAVTSDDLPGRIGANGQRISTGRRVDVHDATLFEIIAVGPDAPARLQGTEGQFCVSLSTFVSPVSVDKPTKFAHVRGKTIPSTFTAEKIHRCVQRAAQLVKEKTSEEEAASDFIAAERRRMLAGG